jgi:CelD/BcsL family acetyltransferase involved in cellulose biosynthesis
MDWINRGSSIAARAQLSSSADLESGLANSKRNKHLHYAGSLHAEAILLQDSSSIEPQWIELSKNAIDPNPFYEPDYLAGVENYLLAGKPQHLILIWSGGPDRKLVGLFPISVRWLRNGYPIPVTCFTFVGMIGICTPLISGSQPDQVWRCFLEFLRSSSDFSEIVHIPEFYADTACGIALQNAAQDGEFLLSSESEFPRAIAECDEGFEDYTKRWSKKKARNLRSRQKKLGELGTLSFEILNENDQHFKDALNATLELEAAGWKGGRGTALISHSDTNKFSQHVLINCRSHPSIHLAVMRLDNRIIAGQINFASQDELFFMKSAYDETLSKFGPGVILYAWIQQQSCDQGLYRILDSCAPANHSLEEIWLERRQLQSLFIAPNSRLNEAKIQSAILGRRMVSKTKAKLKSMRG